MDASPLDFRERQVFGYITTFKDVMCTYKVQFQYIIIPDASGDV
jgi:hypothetical protein